VVETLETTRPWTQSRAALTSSFLNTGPWQELSNDPLGDLNLSLTYDRGNFSV
jgi:hypothetical protein